MIKLLVILLISASFARAITIPANSASLADVQAAVNLAADGDTVLIPNGSAAWSGGISTTKQIKIEARNYVPTHLGDASGSHSVVITNNSAVPLFQFTSGNLFHCGLAGIRFNEGSGNGNHVRFTGTGSKVPLLNDCYFQGKARFGNNPGISAIAWLSQGGVAWNCYFTGRGFGSGNDTGASVAAAFLLINSPRAWNTASTMGTLDTNGTVNVYIEDCTFDVTGNVGDIDDNGRVVFRYCYVNGSVGVTHGFTSRWGGRHWEVYNTTYAVTDQNRNHSARYFWCRAGTGIFTDCVVNNSSYPQEYGSMTLLSIGDNTPPGSYPMPRQPGFGHNGTSSVSDPIYIWSNTGARAYVFGFANGWGSIVVENRDIFVNKGAKPGYSKFTYPHPARAGASRTPTPVPTPTPTPTPVPTPTPTPTPEPTPVPTRTPGAQVIKGYFEGFIDGIFVPTP